jgi:hypothetical protein
MQRALASVTSVAAAALFLLIFTINPLHAQIQTAGLFVYDSASFQGYTLYTPSKTTGTYLIDNYGRVVNFWESSYLPAQSVYLLDNGNIMRSVKLTGGGGVEEVAWDGTVVWFYDNTGGSFRQHHDIEPLPNGNVLLLVRETKSGSEAIAAGRNPAMLDDGNLAFEGIIEIEPTGPTSGHIVWEWNFWDHLVQDFDPGQANYGVVGDHPELLDINFARNGSSDWIHTNAIAYNPDLDQIVVSSRNLNEIYVIDHGTTIHEAAGHTGGARGMGGDILYRWGNPQVYRAGTSGDQKFFGQHDAQWIPAGYPGESNILVYSNGIERPGGEYSSVEEIVTTADKDGNYPQPGPGFAHGPSEPEWIYVADPPESFYSGIISGAQRLLNGNTIVCSGINGRLFEVTSAGDIVWEYINPATEFGHVEQGVSIPNRANQVFKCRRYSPEASGLEGLDLTPGGQIEIYPVSIAGASHMPANPTTGDSIVVTAIVTDTSGITTAEMYIDTGSGYNSLTMFDDGNHHDALAGDSIFGAVIPPLSSPGTISYYIYAEDGSGASTNDPPNAPSIIYTIIVASSVFICGDANGDDQVNVGDAVFTISYVFKGGPAPDPVCEGDSNGDGDVNIGDGVFDINYIFKGGPAPGDDCCR